MSTHQQKKLRINLSQTCHIDGIYSRWERLLSSSSLEYLKTVESSITYFEEPLNTTKNHLALSGEVPKLYILKKKNSAIGLETNNLLKCLRVITIKYLTIHFILQFCNQIKLDICVWWSQAFKEIKDSPKDIMLELKTLH